MIISIAVLPYALLSQFRDSQSNPECLEVVEIKESVDDLMIILYIQECLILLSILACFSMILRTRQIYKRLVTQRKGINQHASTSSYC